MPARRLLGGEHGHLADEADVQMLRDNEDTPQAHDDHVDDEDQTDDHVIHYYDNDDYCSSWLCYSKRCPLRRSVW